jgi:hypothetical protein
VGVAPNDTIRQQHFGSAFATTDYKTNSHNVYVMASHYPTEKLKTVGTFVFNKSTGAYDPIDFPDVSDQLDGHLEHMDYTFEETHQYSELDYTMYQFMLEMEYRLAEAWWLSIGGEYAKMEDNTGYVYGDETGSYYLVKAGARVTF